MFLLVRNKKSHKKFTDNRLAEHYFLIALSESSLTPLAESNFQPVRFLLFLIWVSP